jgi:hypothetical protein
MDMPLATSTTNNVEGNDWFLILSNDDVLWEDVLEYEEAARAVGIVTRVMEKQPRERLIALYNRHTRRVILQISSVATHFLLVQNKCSACMR